MFIKQCLAKSIPETLIRALNKMRSYVHFSFFKKKRDLYRYFFSSLSHIRIPFNLSLVFSFFFFFILAIISFLYFLFILYKTFFFFFVCALNVFVAKKEITTIDLYDTHTLKSVFVLDMSSLLFFFFFSSS
jgi:hypothetical protein